jgi:hypothetical protein
MLRTGVRRGKEAAACAPKGEAAPAGGAAEPPRVRTYRFVASPRLAPAGIPCPGGLAAAGYPGRSAGAWAASCARSQRFTSRPPP